MTNKINHFKRPIYCYFFVLLASISFGSSSATASCGSNHIKSGLGIFSENSLSCKVEKLRKQTCYVGVAQAQNKYLTTSRCVLDPGYIWVEPGAYDFRINIGFSSHIINLKMIKGTHCFDAKNGATGNSTYIAFRFCDASQNSSFSKNEVRNLLKNKSKFGSVRGVSSSARSRDVENNASSTPASPTSSTNLDKAKSTCTDIGFTAGTEKFGECVLKMMEK